MEATINYCTTACDMHTWAAAAAAVVVLAVSLPLFYEIVGAAEVCLQLVAAVPQYPLQE